MISTSNLSLLTLLGCASLASCMNLGTPADEATQQASGSPSSAQQNSSTTSPLGGTSTGNLVTDKNPGTGGIPATPAADPNRSGSGNTPVTANPTPKPTEPVPVTGMDRYTWVGRFDLSNPNAIPFMYLSSKMGVRFTGTSLALDLASTNNDGFNVELDGNKMPPLMLAPSPATRYTVASNLAPGTHTVWLSKRTEFNQNGTNTITLSKMTLDDNAAFLTPPAPKARRIEAIGDSGLAGYGVEGLFIWGDPAHPQCYYETTNQNGDLSVPAQIAHGLNAEIYNLSWSGKAVVSSQYDSNPDHMLPVIWGELVPNNVNRPYDFKVPMDVVIIGAGANDFIGTAGSGTIPDPSAFVQVYADWLVRIRGRYPKALIVAAVGANAKQNDRTLMIQYLTSAVQRAQSTLGNNDPNIIVFDYFANDPNGWTNYGDVADKGGYYWGCNYHPSIAGSTWLSQRMIPVIKAHMGW